MSDLVVTALGVLCPVGYQAASACAAIRAGISRLVEHEGYVCLPPEGPAAQAVEEIEPLVAAPVPLVDDDLDGPERLLALALPALQNALVEAGIGRKDLKRGAMLVALPAPDPVVASWQLGKTFARDLCRRAGVDGWGTTDSIEEGASGVFRALESARALLDTGRAQFCVVVAVDTLIDSERLAHLDRGWRLRSQRNPDGMLPGEAGVAIVLEARSNAERRRASILGVVGRVISAQETATVNTERWSSGEGLCRTLRPLLEGPGGAVGSFVLCDLNGESYRAHEWAVVQTRLGREMPAVEWLVHPAEAVGDVGTAMAGLLVAYACYAFEGGYAPASAALAWVGSDEGGRAAVVIRPGAAGR
jgi:3-oxoacyl-[acyl-carrier-protein] synthase-1